MSRVARACLLSILLVGCAGRKDADDIDSLPERQGTGEVQPQAMIEEAAGQVDPSERSLALGILTEREVPAGGPWAKRGLFDPDPWVQRAVTNALLARSDEEGARAALIGLVARDSADAYVRARVAVRVEGAEVADAWRTQDAPWNQAALALPRAADDAEARAVLLSIIEEGELDLDVDFFRDLGSAGIEGSVQSLERGLEWAEDDLLLLYAMALAELESPKGEALIVRELNGTDEAMQLATLELIGAVDEPWANDLLKAAARGRTAVARVARARLGAHQDAAVQWFAGDLAHERSEVRAAAAEGLGGVDDAGRAAAGELLLPLLSDPVAEVRLAAIRAVRRGRLSVPATALEACLRDDLALIRLEAAAVLVATQ